MPILLDNTAVTEQHACRLIQTPALFMRGPVSVASVTPSSAAAPRTLTNRAASVISAPILLSSVAASVIGAPISIIGAAASEMGAPVVLSTVAATTQAAPRVLTGRAATEITTPDLISAVSASSQAAPRVLTGVASSVIGTPDLITPVSAATQAAPRTLSSVAASSQAAPRVLTADAPAEQATPRVLTPIAAVTGPNYPLTHPRMLYQNLLIGSTVAAGGAGGVNVLNPATYSAWSGTVAPASSAVITFTPTSTLSLDCLCIGAHTLGSMDAQATIRCEYATTVGGAWVDFAPLQTRGGGDNRDVMFLRETPATIAQIRVRVTSATGPYRVAVIYAGLTLQMPRAMYGGHNPITLNRVTDYFNNSSESGNWLGREVRRRGYESTLSFNRLPATWYRQYFEPFARSAITTPFFFAWRWQDYPSEVAYCWTDGDMQPSNSGGATDHMAVSFTVRAHG